MVGSNAVVKRTPVQNVVMHEFHFLLYAMTPQEMSKAEDTQCGCMLLTRGSLPLIMPYMHSEGWIFDVKMLIARCDGKFPMIEVPVGWKEGDLAVDVYNSNAFG